MYGGVITSQAKNFSPAFTFAKFRLTTGYLQVKLF
jgi:hypothetical protein